MPAAAALRHRSFRYLFLSQSISVFGDRLVIVALALYVTQDLGGPGALGIVLAAYTLPLVLLLLIGGVWADRLERQRVMLVTDVVRGLLHAALAALIFTGADAVWSVAAIGVLFGTAEAFFRPAYTGLLPRTVPAQHVQEARALSALSENAAMLAGPAVATAAVIGLGAGAAFALDAATFLLSAALLTQVRPAPGGAAPPGGRVRAQLAEGFAHVRSRPWVWITILCACVVLLVGVAPFFVLGPTVAEEGYGTIAVFGIVQAAFGAGAILGAAAGTRWRPRRPLVAAHIGVLLMPVDWLVFALGAPQPVLYAASVAGGAGFSLFIVWWETALAQRIPPEALSRVSSFDWMGSLALLPLGYALAGPVGEAAGPAEVMIAGDVISIAATLGALASRGIRGLRADVPTLSSG